MIALIALAAASPSPQPGELKTFKDWPSGCDNGRACQVVGLLPENDVDGATITVRREAAAHAVPRVTITSETKAVAGLSIDDTRSVHMARPRGGFFKLASTDTIGFALLLSKLRRIALVDAGGKALATCRLQGRALPCAISTTTRSAPEL